VGIPDFSNVCRAVYVGKEDLSDATFTVVNALLYNLFIERHSLATGPVAQDECKAYVHLCRTNLETALANMPLFLPLNIESVQALLLGVNSTFVAEASY
jgi:hypothetical protein